MDIEGIFKNTQSVSSGLSGINELRDRLENLGNNDEQMKRVAKKFERLFIHQMLKDMKETIPESDLLGDNSGQIESMYWDFMAQTLSEDGGLGMWEEIYREMKASQAYKENMPV